MGVVTPWFVVVGQHDNLPAPQKLRMLDCPFPCPTGIASRQNVDAGEVVHVLFTFGNDGWPVWCCKEFWQAVNEGTDIFN